MGVKSKVSLVFFGKGARFLKEGGLEKNWDGGVSLCERKWEKRKSAESRIVREVENENKWTRQGSG